MKKPCSIECNYNSDGFCAAGDKCLKPITVTRKAYICKNCEYVYADAPVTECDCHVGGEHEYYEGTITYQKADFHSN